jgi:hypothetical protein
MSVVTSADMNAATSAVMNITIAITEGKPSARLM